MLQKSICKGVARGHGVTQPALHKLFEDSKSRCTADTLVQTHLSWNGYVLGIFRVEAKEEATIKLIEMTAFQQCVHCEMVYLEFNK